MYGGSYAVNLFKRAMIDEIAVRSCPLLCVQRQFAEPASGLFYCWSLLRNNNTAINLHMFTSSYGSRRFSACDQGSH